MKKIRKYKKEREELIISSDNHMCRPRKSNKKSDVR
uniref:Uncharacterized protein n=1 Tax=Rhizophora mucronata TaxID=61149 RepID=A0A2P2QC45_RHIMU